jgi:hypothetical protein
MSGSLAGLLYLQLLYLSIGVGLLGLLRVRPFGLRALAGFGIGLAYVSGVAAAGILGAELALIHVPLGLVELTLVALALLGTLWLRATKSPKSELPRTEREKGSLWLRATNFAPLALLGVLLAYALVAVGRRPLLEFDGWAIWGMKARALYQFGGTGTPVFTSDAYPPLQHPLLFPSLEATASRAMGAFDPALFHVQLVLLAAAFAAALVDLYGRRVPLLLAGLVVLSVVSATATIEQLATALADVPLAFFVALGLVGLARWLETDETPPLVCAVLFLGAATLTKSEGALFAITAALALLGTLAATERKRLPRAALAFAGVAAILAPWRLYVAAHDLPIAEYRFTDALSPSFLADHADRVWPAVSGLTHRAATSGFGLLLAVIVLGVAAAVLSRRDRLAAFAVAWLALSFAGLVLIYWISNLPVDLALVWSGGRTVTTLVLAGAALTPLLAARAWDDLSAAASDMRRTRASAPPTT